jgi:hypothetical protein
MSGRVTRRTFLSGAALAAAGALGGCGDSGPSNGFIEFRSGNNLTFCAVGTLHLLIDGSERGTMNAGESRTFPVDPGSHSVSARDQTGTWGPESYTVSAGQTQIFELRC